MATDYGDEAGEKLFDWMLRLGQDAGRDAIQNSATKLKQAIKNARGQAAEATDNSEVKEHALLNLSEFEELPDYATLKQIIDEQLTQAGIEHEFVRTDDHDSLMFKVKDAPEVDEVFANLESQVDKATEHALEELDKELTKERDNEPLEQKVEAAKEASKALSEAKENTLQLEKAEVKTR